MKNKQRRKERKKNCTTDVFLPQAGFWPAILGLLGYSAEGTQPVDVPESTGPRHHIVLGGSSVEEYIYLNKHFIWHVLAGVHFITLVIEVGELSTGSKVKGDFLLKIPVGGGEMWIHIVRNTLSLFPVKCIRFYFRPSCLKVFTWSDHPLPVALSPPRQTHPWLSGQLGTTHNTPL